MIVYNTRSLKSVIKYKRNPSHHMLESENLVLRITTIR